MKHRVIINKEANGFGLVIPHKPTPQQLRKKKANNKKVNGTVTLF